MKITVTTEQLAEIERGIASGESHRAIAARLGIDRRTVDRKAKTIGAMRPRVAAAPVAPAAPVQVDDESHLETLRASRKRLADLVLCASLPPRDLAVLNRELRDTLDAIELREAALKQEARDEQGDVTDGAASVLAKLRRIAEVNDEREEQRRCEACGAHPGVSYLHARTPVASVADHAETGT